MRYAQLNEDGTFRSFITNFMPQVWDDKHTCAVQNLTAEERDLFRIVLVEVTEPPTVGTNQVARLTGVELVNGTWQYKWTVVAMTAEEIAAAEAEADAKARAEAIDLAVLSDNVIVALVKATPTSIDNAVNAITNLNDAKVYLRRLTKAVLYLARHSQK